MKKTLMIVGAVLLAALIAAGSFWGGMTYQTRRTDQARVNFMNARGITDVGQPPAGSNAPGGATSQMPGMSGRGGTTGQVKTIDGNTITISTAQNVTTVKITDSTRVEKSTSVSIADIQTGMQVMITGQADSKGTITASQIQILNINPANSAYPAPTQPIP